MNTKTMHNRSMNHRLPYTLALALSALGAQAQDPGMATAAAPYPTLMWILVGIAVAQAIIILALSGVMRNLAGLGRWARGGNGTRAWVAIPIAFGAATANAQAYVPPSDPSTGTTLWTLVGVNLFLFAVIVFQLRWIRSRTTDIAPPVEGVQRPVRSSRAARWAALVAKLNRQVEVEEEKTIELDHEYDGIKELDNVLPPWWLWLFYGTIAWGVIYLVNVHVIKVWPDSQKEYQAEMVQAQADVAAYLATQTNLVDENTVTFTDDPAVIAEGRSLFSEFCTACHGADAAGSENSVGPNLTDGYWLHGGGVKNIFHTIKYGVPEKGMIAWKAQLQPSEIRAIACYIMSREGQGGPNQKAPQGELWKGDEGAAEVDAVVPPAGVVHREAD